MIQGSAPYLLLSDGTKLKNLNQLLGFSMPKQDGSEGTELIDATKDVVTAPKGMKLSDVKVIVVADNQAHTLPTSYQQDDDGDNSQPSGSITAVWKVDGLVVSDLNQPLNPCGAYTLTMSINHLQAQTTYGVPNSTDYGSATKTYVFKSSDMGICYIKPLSMHVYTGTAGVNIKFAQGYNPDVWDAGKGFSVSKMRATTGKQFPTVGFNRAVFDLIGSGSDQSKYRCSKNGSWVNLSGSASKNLGANCRVTYNTAKKPNTSSTIDMEYKKDDGTWVKIDSYTISPPVKWAVGGYGGARFGNSRSLRESTVFYVLDWCRGVQYGTTTWSQGALQDPENRAFREKYLYRRNEFDNSPFADPSYVVPEGSGHYYTDSRYSRDVDGTFMGEWGYVQVYGGSPFSPSHWYWAAEGGTHYQSLVHTFSNITSSFLTNAHGTAVCRGE